MNKADVPAAKDLMGLKVGAAVLVMVASFSIGAASTAAKTVEVERVVEKIVTKTQRVEVTPTACLLYITQSEEAIGYASEALGHARDVIRATDMRDPYLMDAANAGLDTVNLNLERLTPDIIAAKKECRSK